MTNLKEMINADILLAHQLCVGLGTRLTGMESQMAGLQPLLTTTPGTLYVMLRRLGAIEDQMGKMSENPGDRSIEPGPEHDLEFYDFDVMFSLSCIFMVVMDTYV